MKKSTNLKLLVLGTAVFLSACSEEPPTDPMPIHQNSYNSIDDCKRDWDVRECSTNNSAHHGGVVMPIIGPRYYWDSTTSTPMAVSESGTPAAKTSALTPSNSGRAVATVSRGGFGAHASAGGHAGSSGG